MDKGVHCLFCREKCIPYTISTDSSTSATTGENSCGEETSFSRLCQYLSIEVGVDWCQRYKGVLQLKENLSDDDGKAEGYSKFLCLNCFELVEELRKLYQTLEKVQQEIEGSKRHIKRVIITAGSEGVTNGRKNKRGRPKRNRKDDKELELVEAFQALVKGSQKAETDFIEDLGSYPELRSTRGVKATTNNNKYTRRLDKTGDSDDDSNVPLKLEPNEDDIVKIEEETEDDVAEGELDTLLDSKGEEPGRSSDGVNAEDVLDQDSEVETGQNNDSGTRRKSVRNITGKKDRIAADVVPPKRKRAPRTEKISDSAYKFTCRYCQAIFRLAHQYYTHRKSHLPSGTKPLDIRNVYGVENGKKIIIARICSICGHRVNGRRNKLSAFMEHMLSHENFTLEHTATVYECDQCDRKFTIQLNLDLHRKYNHEWQNILLKCEFCGAASKTQAEFALHIQSHDGVTRTHSCKNCPMVCTSLDKLLDHMVKHSRSRQLYCPECPQLALPSMKELYQHCFKAHPDLKEKLSCPHHCGKTFLLPVTLRNHVRTSHGVGGTTNGERGYFCSHCNNGKNYKFKQSLERHIQFFHDDHSRRYKCEKCDKAFVYKSILDKHIHEKHDGTRYQCPYCPKSYSEQAPLSHHIRRHTGEGMLPCPVCAKTFPTRGQLNVHSAVHAEKIPENSFICDTCGKEFFSEIRLRRHKTIHKEKKIECPHQSCKMMFGRREHLRCHLRTHSEERPFACPICKKGFKSKGVLIVHLRGHDMSHEEAKQFYQLQQVEDKD